MKIKNILTIALTKRVLLAIEKLINLRCSIKGIENIPKSTSMIFAPNHFTRFETFVVPYFLNKISDLKFCRSLADSSLFTSYLGKYLRNLQTISTHDENRDKTIISDLSENQYNWVIYPEGMMVKDKQREVKQGFFQNRLSIKTGTAVLAMKAEFARQEKNNTNPVCIIPVTISYIPIYPQENKILSIVKRFTHKIPKRLEEELLVEGALLLNSKIIIHFHKPIYIADYIIKDLYIHKLFNLSKETLEKTKISKYRIPIAMKIADEIYKHAQITHEHIISLLLKNLEKNEQIAKEKLPFFIITCVLELKKHSNIQEFCENIKGEQLFKYTTGNIAEINQFLALLQQQKVIKITKDFISTEEAFHHEYNFNTVRVENISKIFLNELSYFTNTDIIAKAVLKMQNHEIMKLCFNSIEESYSIQHKITFNESHSIQVQYGKPFFMEGKNNRAVLLIHGYKSSPTEMKEVAEFLNKKGLTCYGVRMAGHGTSPFDMANTTHEDWINSCEIAYNILKLHFEQIDICGFSTGGLIAMQLAQKYNVHTITLINSALELCDVRFRFVKFASLWSDVASKVSKNHKGYIQDTPFYPETNYSINHFSSMRELSKLMEKCKNSLNKITCDTLVLQSDSDPVVQPKSGKIIYEGIQSKTKILETIPSNEHVITRGKEFKKIQEIVTRFLI